MPPLRRKRKSRTIAPAIVYFTKAKNKDGQKQICVYAECVYGGTRYGPVWAHTRASVDRCLANLTKKCDCGRKYHKHRFSEGKRVMTSNVDA